MRIVTVAALAALPFSALADDLVLSVESDLAALGYAAGPVDGQETIETTIAVSKFQAENELPITGEVTPELATALSQRRSAPTGEQAPAVAAGSQQSPAADLQAARQACLEERIAAAQEAEEKKRGLRSLVSAVSNTVARYGNNEVARDIAKTTRDVYDADATAGDWRKAAKDLGLKKKDIRACENPFEES